MAAGDWRNEARRLDEIGMSRVLDEVHDAATSRSPEDEFLFEELREALLDLKQAVIDDTVAAGLRAMQEISDLLEELDDLE